MLAVKTRDRQGLGDVANRSESTSAVSSTFDILAIPKASSPSLISWETQAENRDGTEEDSLLILGQEPLFAGSKSSQHGRHAMGQNKLMAESKGKTASPRMTHEVIQSLHEAKYVFLKTLCALLEGYSNSGILAALSAITMETQSKVGSLTPASTHPSSSRAAKGSRPNQVFDVRLLDALKKTKTSNDYEVNPGLNIRTPEDSNAWPAASLSSVASTHVSVEDINSEIDTLANDLPPLEAELARCLSCLLMCMDRLLLYCHEDGSEASGYHEDESHWSKDQSADETRTATSSKDIRLQHGVSQAALAAKNVEAAERDLLWGQVDALAETVGELCRSRAQKQGSDKDGRHAQKDAPEEEQETMLISSPAPSTGFKPAPETVLLPSYSPQATSTNEPPSYYTDASDSIGISGSDWDHPPLTPIDKLPLSFSSPINASSTRRLSGAASEKAQIDLDSVSSAIERLYVVSPQLANQRIEPDRRRLRERQLTKLGDAIEKLSQGRMNDQRATSSPTMGDVDAHKALRMKKVQDAALDNLISQIDRATSRSLLDQRADPSALRQTPFTQEHHDIYHLSDLREEQRRDHIMENTGKGRLETQDASFSHVAPAETFPGKPSDTPVTLAEFFAYADGSASSSYTNTLPRETKSVFSTVALEQENSKGTSNGSSRVPKASSKRSVGEWAANFKVNGIGNSWQNKMVRSRSGNLAVLEESAVEYLAEESRNLSTVTVSFWPSTSEVSSSKKVWEVVRFEDDSLLVAPPDVPVASRILLPCSVPEQNVVVAGVSVFEMRLATANREASSNRIRPDLEIRFPWDTAELRTCQPSSFACALCDTRLAETSAVSKYNALPSEHWAELLEAWMCHQDQSLSEDLISKGKGIKPRSNEILVGSTYILFPRELTQNWHKQEKGESHRSEADDLLTALHCAKCNVLVGQHVTSISTAEAKHSYVRLLKYATNPKQNIVPNGINARLQRYNLSCHLSALMLEIGQAHACHRFVIEDQETESMQLLLWLFNPSVRISFSTSSPSASLLEAPNGASTGTGSCEVGSCPPLLVPISSTTVTRSMNVVRIFYKVVQGDGSDAVCQEFLASGQSTTERLLYPRYLVEQLRSLLEASTLVYPPSKRTWAGLDVGFLERI